MPRPPFAKPCLLVLLVLAPALAGCLSEEPAATREEAALPARDAAEAGARTGEAPSAPKEAYVVEPSPETGGEAVVAHPLAISTNPARAPVTLDFSGEYRAQDCRGWRLGSLEPTLAAASNAWRLHDFADQLQVGDVFEYDVTMTYVNTDEAWAEIHMWYAIGNSALEHGESTREAREPVIISWSGESYRSTEEDAALLSVMCWAGVGVVPYTLTVTLRFAENAIPAEVPMRVSVPEEATRLFVSGVAVDGGKGVLSHFRLFDPEDRLVCECALSSNEAVAVVPLASGAGDYVLLVDHTANGFVGVALDVPPPAPVVPMPIAWVETSIYKSDGGAVDTLVEFDLPTVPLLMFAAATVDDAQSLGAGKKTHLAVTNDRGEVMRVTWGGHMTWRIPDNPAGGGTPWMGFWPADWEESVDHHAYGNGKHTAHVSAESFRGEIKLLTRQYVR